MKPKLFFKRNSSTILTVLGYVVKSMQELNQRVSELEKENEKLKRKLNLN